jgi:hypothetical protein
MSENRSPPILTSLQPLPRRQGNESEPRPNPHPMPSLRLRAKPPSSQRNASPVGRSTRAMKQDLAKVAAAWGKMQKTRDRDAIYGYLEAVYDLVQDWERRGRADRKARRALRARGLKSWPNIEPFAVAIACTSEVDGKTRSKWSRALQYVSWYNRDQKPFKKFMKSKGGINGCASLFAHRLGRKS